MILYRYLLKTLEKNQNRKNFSTKIFVFIELYTLFTIYSIHKLLFIINFHSKIKRYMIFKRRSFIKF